jgi:hypothetical protein
MARKQFDMRRKAKSVVVGLAMVLFSAVPSAAAPIQIGSFGWEVVLDTDPEHTLLCGGVDPCARFTVTNDLGLLSASELIEVNLTGTEDFATTEITELPAVLGDIAAGTSASVTDTWPFATASLTFDLPASLNGILVLPSLSGPTSQGPVAINVNTGPSLAEPVPLALVALSVIALYARRRAPA